MKLYNRDGSFRYFHYDMKNIQRSLSSSKTPNQIWTSDYLIELKKRIKKFHINFQKEKCCYCQRSFRGEFMMVIDIEHILPQSKYRQFMLHIDDNLSVSCKRCNMKIKKEDTSFLNRKKVVILKNPYDSKNYKFIHPNLDKYDTHMKVIRDNELVKYKPRTDKGRYTYNYFKLQEFELAAFDRRQGITRCEKISNRINYQHQQKISKQLNKHFKIR